MNIAKTIHHFENLSLIAANIKAPLNQKLAAEYYLDCSRNFLTVKRFSEHYSIDEKMASTVIELGKNYNRFGPTDASGLFTNRQWEGTTMTKIQIVEQIYPGITFDYVLPQDWLDKASGDNILNYRMLIVECVMLYPDNCTFGVVAPLSLRAKELLISLNEYSDLLNPLLEQ